MRGNGHQELRGPQPRDYKIQSHRTSGWLTVTPLETDWRMSSFDPDNVNLHTAGKEDILCYLETSDNEYNGQLEDRKYGVHKAGEATHAFVQHEQHLDVQPGSEIVIENAMHAVKGRLRADTFQSDVDSIMTERSFRQQIAAFCLLEFGIIFHSVIIGLNLGVTGSEFATLYPYWSFHCARHKVS